MDLKAYLRSNFTRNIRNHYVKSKCEVCGTTENLELHHKVPFETQLNKTLDKFGYKYERTSKFESDEIKDINTYMIGLQIIDGFSTMCSSCHMGHHHNRMGSDPVREGFKRWVERKRIKREAEELNRIESKIIPYLENNLGKRFYGEDRDYIINAVNFKKNGRVLRSYRKINNRFFEDGIPYKIVGRKTGSRRYWQVTKIDNYN